MAKLTKDSLFQPKLSAGEAKRAATDKVAQTMIDQEVANRDAKTARLRLARLAKEAAERDAAASAPPPAKSVRKRS